VSVPVDLAALAEKIEAFGAVSYLVTTGNEGAPHVVSVVPAWEGDDLVVSAGQGTMRNAGAHPTVTLLWPGAAGADYSLIVDGQARVMEGPARIVIQPTKAVLHRLPQADASLPSCVTVLD
jgi:hypothetical protein